MLIELDRDDVVLIRDLLRQRVVELDKEISRTDHRDFKHELQQLDRATERVLARISAALERTATDRSTSR